MKHIAFSLFILFISTTLAIAQSGSPDTGFANSGIFTSQIDTTPDEAKALAIQADGKIVTAGYIGLSGVSGTTAEDFYLRRFNADGSPDTDFGDDGIVIQDLSGGTDAAWDVEIQSDGKILATGFGWQSWERALVMRFNTNGSMDTDFSGDGMAAIEIGGFIDRLWDIEIQDDGKIVGCGTCFVSGSNNDWCAMRLNPNGTLDNTFGNGGVLTLDLGAVQVSAEDLAILDDGRILMAGYGYVDGAYLMQFAMLNSDGSLDESWSEDGLVEVSINNVDDALKSIAIQEDGKILGGGYSRTGNDYDFALVRLNADGTLDETFGDGGHVITPVSTWNDFIESIYLKPDGQIVAGGHAFTDENGFDFVVAMYTPDGSLQTAFGSDGIATTALSPNEDYILEVKSAPDGNILAAGTTVSETSGSEVFELALVKFIDDLILGVIDQGLRSELLVYPNPIATTAQLRFELAKGDTYRIDLYDISGRHIAEILQEQPYQTGLNEVALHFPDYLKSGNYILRIQSQSTRFGVMICKN